MLPYDTHTATLTTALANVSARYNLGDVSLRVDLGIGTTVLSGVDVMDNPFTSRGEPATGALGMLAVRVGASIEYAFARDLFVTLMPVAFTYSPAHEGLRNDLGAVGRIEVALGVGYRM